MQYGTAYLNYDLNWAEHGQYSVNSFPLYTDLHYSNLHYDPFSLDLQKTALNYTHMIVDDAAVIYAELPAVKYWRVGFDYLYSYLGSHEGRVDFEFHDLWAIVTSELRATTDGHLYPHLHDIKINIEHSSLHHEDWFAQFFYRQIFDLSKYIIQNAYNWFGASIINRNLYDISKGILKEQIYDFPLEVQQLGKNGTFNLNWRLTADPKIHNHELDMSFFFDIGPEEKRCLVEPDQHDYYFQDNFKSKYVQFILSDRVPNCLMAAMERQHWFKYSVDTKFMVEHFGTHLVPINAALLKRAFPMIAETYGDEQELELDIEWRQPRVSFGTTDRDMIGQVTLKMAVKLAGERDFIIYDELDIYIEGDMAIDQEVLLGNVQKLVVTKAAHTDTSRSKPIYDNMNMTAEQYADFWVFVEGMASRWQTFFNEDVLSAGVPLPYWNLEFLTKFTFHPHAIIAVMDIFYNNVGNISN